MIFNTATRPMLLGYYPSWQTEVPPARLDFGLYTHIAHAFALVGADGRLKDDPRIPDPELARRAHAAKCRVLLALGGADSNKSLTEAVADGPRGAARLTNDLVDRVLDANYDGIDVDWEFPESNVDRDRMNDLVARLRAEFTRRGRPDCLVTMAVPAQDWSGKWYVPDALLPHLDFVNVMTYDFHGPWSPNAGHNAPLPALAASLDYWTRVNRWPKAKLLLGIPCYGRGFAVSKWGDAQTAKPEHAYVDLDGVANLRKAGWTREWDDSAAVPYLVKPGGGELISYEDAASAARKAAWIRDAGVAGAFFWEIASDFDGKTHPIARSVRPRLG